MNKDRLAGVVARVNTPPTTGDPVIVSPRQSVEQDETTEALRRALNKLPRYSFLLDASGSVRRVPDRSGRWIDWSKAHELFDPVVVDALRGRA